MKNNDHPYPYFNMVEKMTRFGCGAIHRYIIDLIVTVQDCSRDLFFYWYSHK